eukprot:402652-Pyramimonas_sp.AAC.2
MMHTSTLEISPAYASALPKSFPAAFWAGSCDALHQNIARKKVSAVSERTNTFNIRCDSGIACLGEANALKRPAITRVNQRPRTSSRITHLVP